MNLILYHKVFKVFWQIQSVYDKDEPSVWQKNEEIKIAVYLPEKPDYSLFLTNIFVVIYALSREVQKVLATGTENFNFV